MTRNRAYMLGAGASHSYGGSINGIKPPLARDFFKAFNKLEISSDVYVRIGNIINYVRDTRNYKVEDFSKWNEDIEAFLTEVDNLIIEQAKKHKESSINADEYISLTKVYDQMIFLFTSVLNEIQNGKVCDNYSKLVKKINDGDALITFNWDTLLDRALYESDKWFIEDGYNLEFKGIFRDGWENGYNNKKSKVSLLKLHGSTNWLMPYYSIDFYKGTRSFANKTVDESQHPIYCFHYHTKPYETYKNRSLVTHKYSPFSYYYYPPNIPIESDSKVTRKEHYKFLLGMYPDVPNYGKFVIQPGIKESMPFIIPPVKYKNYGLVDGLINNLWKKAEESISKCDELYIIGYSFPKTDTRAWELLENALKKRNTYPKIIIVDPYPDSIAKRLVERFENLSDVSIYPITFDLFVANEYM